MNFLIRKYWIMYIKYERKSKDFIKTQSLFRSRRLLKHVRPFFQIWTNNNNKEVQKYIL